MSIVRTNRLIGSLLALALLSSIATASTADNQWEFAVEGYLWGANVDIETETGSHTEIRFTDIVDDFKLGGMLLVSAQRNRWKLMLDVIYLDIDDNVEEPIEAAVELNDLGLEAWVATPVVGYELYRSDRNTLYLIGGARYLWIDVNEKFYFEGAPSAKFSSSSDSWDGLIGVRGEWVLSDRWYVSYHLDVGTGDSDSTSQALTAVGYRFDMFDALFGYRYLDWKDTENDALKNLDMSGFMAGVRYRF